MYPMIHIIGDTLPKSKGRSIIRKYPESFISICSHHRGYHTTYKTIRCNRVHGCCGTNRTKQYISISSDY
jgi:hypothetical protein